MSIFLPAQDPKVAKVRRRWIFVAIAMLILMAVAVSPLTRTVQKLRARKSVAEAEAYLAQGRREEALRAGQAALKAGADDARTWTAMLRILGPENATEAFPFWVRLGNEQNISLETRRLLVRSALSWGQPSLAETHWRELVKANEASVETLRLGAAYCELNNDASGAVRYARAVLEQFPEDAEAKFLMGRVLVRKGNDRDVEIGRRLLMEVARREDASGLLTIRLLSETESLLQIEAAECLEFLARNKARSDVDLLTAAALEARLTPYKREQIIAAAARDFSTRNTNLTDLARWLGRGGYFEVLTTVITEKQALGSSEVLALYLDALGALNKWDEAERILSEPKLPLDSLQQALYLARCADQQRQGRVAEHRWTQALELAGKDGRSLLKVVDYARRSGAVTIAEQACERLIQGRGELAQIGHRELLKIHFADLPKAREILKRYLADFPNELAAKSDLAYIELLLGTPEPKLAEAAVLAAEAMVLNKPDFIGYRTTHALALLRAGKPEAAKRAFNLPGEEYRALLPYQQAVYAAALGACGEESRAREVSAGIDRERLRPQETELIQRWL